jgi:chromatin segregation and condensation protein Rec8/ScpA/Scc1 (kleisin family)
MTHPGNIIPGLSSRQLRRMAKKLAKSNPELRDVYNQSKIKDPNLDTKVDDLTEELEDVLNEQHNSKPESG